MNKEKKFVLMTNQKWKEYKVDKKTSDLMNALEEMRENQKKRDFMEWLNLNLIIYGDERDNERPICVKKVLKNLIDDINKIVEEKGRAITNKKRLRDTIASMIYKESRYGR
tara:strand:+ start:586 stop:918 length:333 start_codon:yes stop_codon:yes gene_type:complete